MTCARGHSVTYDGCWYHVYCFAQAADAERFMRRFGGEKFDPKQRGRGSNWAKWNKVLRSLLDEAMQRGLIGEEMFELAVKRAQTEKRHLAPICEIP